MKFCHTVLSEITVNHSGCAGLIAWLTELCNLLDEGAVPGCRNPNNGIQLEGYRRLRRHFFDEASARECSFQGAIAALARSGKLDSHY